MLTVGTPEFWAYEIAGLIAVKSALPSGLTVTAVLGPVLVVAELVVKDSEAEVEETPEDVPDTLAEVADSVDEEPETVAEIVLAEELVTDEAPELMELVLLAGEAELS